MANPEHEEILTRGVAAWNSWRVHNWRVRPELRSHALRHELLGVIPRDLMDGLSNEERREAWQAYHNGSLYYDDQWKANWSIKDLRGINFKNVDLADAKLIIADLSDANLSNADLQGANLQDTILKDADLTNANLEGAVLGNTKFANTNLTLAKGLLSCRHIKPSYIDLATIHKSSNLPQDFLLGCGLNILDIRIAEISKPGLAPAQIAEMADNIRKFADQPFQSTSCFISYSKEDTDFANQLYDDLRRKKVQCWFAPHDIRGGRKIHDQIDDAIRRYDRVLLVLSEHSMNSEWVKTEIANARKKELLEKRNVLFPIGLVSYDAIQKWKCFDADIGKDSAREVREYFIPDFSNWRDKVVYEKAFQRLIDDLGKLPQVQ